MTMPAAPPPPLPAYDPKHAARVARHAAAIYESQTSYWRQARRDGMDSVIIAQGATQAGIAYSAREIIVSWRGTSEIGDIFDDLFAARVGWTEVILEGLVHFGFKRQVLRVMADFQNVVKDLAIGFPSAEISVGGHSLGGANALFATVLLSACGSPARLTYTFESPRAMTRPAARWFDRVYGSQVFRIAAIRNCVQDIVPRLPLSLFGWDHTGRPVIYRDGVRHESVEAWDAARRDFPTWRVVSRLCRGVRAHSMDSLLLDIERDAAGETEPTYKPRA